MQDPDWLAAQFEENRGHLRGVAYRMLGSLSEADDAVQEAWLKVGRAGADGVANLRGWLTTILARVCLDMLRSRHSCREEPQDEHAAEPAANQAGAIDPEREALLAESVGLALLVVLDKLEPAERLAFVLHDMFAVPFDEIAPIVGRTEMAARQLASRARRRLHGEAAPEPGRTGQRRVVDAFLSALRRRDFEGLLAVLDPEVLVRAESAEGIREIRGARNWARGAAAFAQNARFMQIALVDGSVGIILAPGGHLQRAVRFTIVDERIVEAEVIVRPERLRSLHLALLEE